MVVVLLVAVLGLGEAGGRVCGGGMATVSLGRGEQRRSQHGGEEGEAARVRPGEGGWAWGALVAIGEPGMAATNDMADGWAPRSPVSL